MATESAVFIDATWWFGGNRERGIGRYLTYFFQFVWKVEKERRVWLVPAGTAPEKQHELLQELGGAATLELEGQTHFERLVEEWRVELVFLPSPFERPFSLLDFIPHDRSYRVEAMVFDLLPLRFPQELLATWPEADQSEYRSRVEQLKSLDALWAISPDTKRDVVELAGVEKKKVTVLNFGLSTEWIEPPKMNDEERKLVHLRPIALTISGGEWHKNLMGTLEYFRDHLAEKHDLYVICSLGNLGVWKWRWRAWRLGIGRRTHFLGQVDERTKWQYLYNADVFLFLSHAEGLGIPVLEAKKARIRDIIVSSELQYLLE